MREEETGATVLLIDADPDCLRSTAAEMEADGFIPVCCGSLASGLDAAGTVFPDLAVVDPWLPDGLGFDLVRIARFGSAGPGRQIDPGLPIMILSARCSESDRVRAFEVGADDFLAKPFSYRELRGRLSALLRRREGHLRSGPTRVGQLRIDPARREVSVGDRDVALTQKEFRLLQQLAAEPGRVFTKDELLRAVWGFQAPGAQTTRTLDSHACRLRQKLKAAGEPRCVQNVWGVGYRLDDTARVPENAAASAVR